MAFMNRIGHIFFGHAINCYEAPTVYAFQIIGSTAKLPICRPITVYMIDEPDGHGSGSWSACVDENWLADNSNLGEALRKATPDYPCYRVRYKDDDYDEHWRIRLIVPNTAERNGNGNLLLPLYTLEEMHLLRASGAYGGLYKLV